MAFKLLHAADLHLGQRFHDHDRGDEESHALDQIVDLARREEVDVVALAGDIFDAKHPNVREMERYHKLLERLAFEAKVGSVIVIAGNHDNGTRIEGPREFLRMGNVHTRGSWRLDDPLDHCLIELKGRTGAVVGQALAIPFLNDGDIRPRRPGEDTAAAARAHVEALQERLGALHARVAPDMPLIVIAHAFATGGTFGGGERPIQVGNQARVPAAVLAGNAAYLGLGHLHRPQAVAGNNHWRYPGSMLPTGFDELEHPRQVVIAEVPDRGPAIASFIDLAPYRQYKRLEGTPAQLSHMIENLPECLDGSPRSWVRAYAQVAAPEPGLGQHLSDLAQQRGWQLLGVVIREHRGTTVPDGAAPATVLPSLDLTDARAVFTQLLTSRGFDDEVAAELLESFTYVQEHCDQLLEEGD